MSQHLATLLQIGQLLTRSGLLTDEDLAGALIRSRERGLPIGTVLLTMGCLRQIELRAAVEAQSMVNDGLVTAEVAASALAQVATDGKNFEEALKTLGWHTKTTASTNRLGELLVDAGFIDEDLLTECLATSMETGMPLGRVLTFKRTIPDDLLLAGLKAQRMIREGAITRDNGIEVLKEVKDKQVSIEQGLVNSGVFKAIPKRSRPLGYLLVDADYISEVNLMTCVELSATKRVPMMEVLVEQGYASTELARASMEIQHLIDDKMLPTDYGVDALRLLDEKGLSQSRAVAASGMPPLAEDRVQTLKELAILTGLVNPQECQRFDECVSKDFFFMAEKLSKDGFVTDPMIDALARALYLIEIRLLLTEDAVMALHYSKKNLVSLDEALNAMGWKPPNRGR